MVTFIAFRTGRLYCYETKHKVRKGKKLLIEPLNFSASVVTTHKSRRYCSSDYSPRVILHKLPFLPILISFGRET